MTRTRGSSLVAVGTLSVCLTAQGASIGAPEVQAVLGQPLQMVIPLSVDGDDSVPPECVRAEVQSGESWLSSDLVQVRVSPTANRSRWNVEVRTRSVVEEPVLQVRLTVLCGQKQVRTFTALADPPVSSNAMVPPVASAAVKAPARPTSSDALAAPDPAAAASNPARPAHRRKNTKSLVRVDGQSPSDHQAPLPLVQTWDEGQMRPQNKVKRPRGGARLELDPGYGPLLKMDLEDAVFAGAVAKASAAAVNPAASMATPPMSAETAASQTLDRLSTNAVAMAAANQQLQERLQRAETRANWLSGLFGASLLAAAAALLIWRRRIASKARASDWWDDSKDKVGANLHDESLDDGDVHEGEAHYEPAPLPAAPRPAVPVDAVLPLGPLPTARPQHDQTVAIMPRRPLHLPEAEAEAPGLGLPLDVPLEPPRAVSVEELMDVEQQADFFVALGQEDAAIEVLMASLRGNGGQSPVPYSKLLEIYRRQGDRAAYERIRNRFNRRFNVYAPEWGGEPQAGAVLEDYPDAVRELQSVWPAPLDAMAVLEAMLFRRDERLVLFDLPAYLDLLLLYAIAREHWQLGGTNQEGVDLLLPLTERAAEVELDPPTDGPHTRNTAPGLLDFDPGFLTLEPIADKPAVSELSLDFTPPASDRSQPPA
jgi:pilus assembly protein FimV